MESIFEINPLAPYHVLQDFSPNAASLRNEFDSHFATPYEQGAGHQVWNYWYVPDSYTYLRTGPENVIAEATVDLFFQHVKSFAREWLGMNKVTWPFLSLYVEGCKQTIHNDSCNGHFGYVYSLTNWDRRSFHGGETLIFREQDYWASGRFRSAGAGSSFYEKIPSRFNQLLVFDDRLLHGVPEVRGTQDPREGRVVLHGHIECGGICVDGPLEELLASDGLGDLADILAKTQNSIDAECGRYHGFATIELNVSADGIVTSVRPLVQRVLGSAGPETEVSHLLDLRRNLRKLRVAAQAGPSRIAVPQLFT